MTVLKALAAAAVLATVAAASAPVQAQPSFNCARARTFVEKAICGSPSLAAKDRKMSRLYFEQLSYYREYGDTLETNAFKAEQRSWLAQRDRCQTTKCVHLAYDRRIAQLEQSAD
jgi:uncharacterized protein